MAMRIVARNGQGVDSSEGGKDEAPVDVPGLVAENRRVLMALTEADAGAQGASDVAAACADAIVALLSRPDSGGMRRAVARLARVMAGQVAEAANTINCLAEDFGVNHVDQAQDRQERLFFSLASGEVPHG